MDTSEILQNNKAVLMDYTGTIIREGGPEIEEMIARVYKNSDFGSPKEALRFWYQNLAVMEHESYMDTFKTEDEICLQLLDLCAKEHNLRDSSEELHNLNRNFWRNGPVFEDAVLFFEKCDLPVYVLTNNASEYVAENLAKKGIHPAGIVSAEDVRAYKPHREIFERALALAGVTAAEVVHIGDSYASDVTGARQLGIEAVLVDRKGKNGEADCAAVKSLAELF